MKLSGILKEIIKVNSANTFHGFPVLEEAVAKAEALEAKVAELEAMGGTSLWLNEEGAGLTSTKPAPTIEVGEEAPRHLPWRVGRKDFKDFTSWGTGELDAAI